MKNEQYTGTYIAGRSFQDDNGGKYHTPPSEWIIIPNRHPAIISKEAFECVQVLLTQGKRKFQPYDYLLKGKIVCGTCSRAMVYSTKTTQPMYRCMNTHADTSAACHKLQVPTSTVEDAVMTIIKKQAEVVLNSDDLSGFRKKATDDKLLDTPILTLHEADIEKQISLLSKQRQDCYEQFICCEIDRDAFREAKVDLTNQIDRLTQQLSLSRQTARKRDADRKTAALAKNALSNVAQPKDIVDALIEKILVFPNGHIEIHWKCANFAEAV
jgi:hypothetical protein